MGLEKSWECLALSCSVTANLDALKNRQTPVAADQVDQTPMVNINVVAADALGSLWNVGPSCGLFHQQRVGDVDNTQSVGEPVGQHQVVCHPHFVGLQPWRYVDRCDDPEVGQIGYITTDLPFGGAMGRT